MDESAVQEAREALGSGKAKLIITSPTGTAVSFRFNALLDKERNWDGRGWWLRRGGEYVGIVERRGTALELRLTESSTRDRLILRAADVLLARLSGVPLGPYALEVASTKKAGAR